MSDDPQDSGGSRPRRGSITNTLGNIFARTPSVPNATAGTPSLPTPISTAASGSRRMSITTLGLSGTSPSQAAPFFTTARRTSISTSNSDSIDESVIEDDDNLGRSVPATPLGRRMSLGAQALFSNRSGNRSPGSSSSSARAIPHRTASRSSANSAEDGNASTQASMQSRPRTISDFSKRSGEGLNLSEQFRSRAESVVTRPAVNTSPTSNIPRSPSTASHERAKSVSDMPAPPTTAIPVPRILKEDSALRRKPDAVGERILRGEFHMD